MKYDRFQRGAQPFEVALPESSRYATSAAEGLLPHSTRRVFVHPQLTLGPFPVLDLLMRLWLFPFGTLIKLCEQFKSGEPEIQRNNLFGHVFLNRDAVFVGEKKKGLFLVCFYEFLTELLVCLVLLARCPFLPPHILPSVHTNDRKPSSLRRLVHSGTAGIEKYHQPVCASYFKLRSILWCLTLFNYVRTYHSTRFYNSQRAEPTTQLVRNILV